MAENLNWREKQKLLEWIGNGIQKFELLFSIKRGGCNSIKFHELCDGKGPTITVLYNTNGSVFGGYTSVAWGSLGCYRMDNNAFLFQLRYNGVPKTNKFPHRDGKKAIYDGRRYGPYFGSGPDLFTFKDTVEINKDYFILNGKMKSSTYDMSVCGKEEINNGCMHIRDLEVYAVQESPEKNWRTSPGWDEKTLMNLKEEIRNFKYPANITQANILLLGPILAGKSSFLNTAHSSYMGYYAPLTNSGSTGESLTTKFCRHQVSEKDDEPLPFILCDTRGLDDLDIRDLEHILDGNIPDGYQFKKDAPFQGDTQVDTRKPSLDKKIHCVAYVVDGNTLDIFPPNLLQKMKQFQKIIHEREIQEVALLTKVDMVCPLVKKDMSMMFDSAIILDIVEKTAHVLGITSANVLPIKNYDSEQEVKVNIDILALLSLRQMLRISYGFIRTQSKRNKESE